MAYISLLFSPHKPSHANLSHAFCDYSLSLFSLSLYIYLPFTLPPCLPLSTSLYVTCVCKCLFHSLSLSRIYLIPFLRNFLKSMVCEPGCARMIQYLEPSPRIITQ